MLEISVFCLLGWFLFHCVFVFFSSLRLLSEAKETMKQKTEASRKQQ